MQRIRVLVTVKAYPAVSTKYGDLDQTLRFKKYQVISIEAERHSSDTRPETVRPNIDTLELHEELGTRAHGQPAARLWNRS